MSNASALLPTGLAEVVPMALFLVDANRWLLRANPIAQQLIEDRDPFDVADGVLTARTTCGEHLLEWLSTYRISPELEEVHEEWQVSISQLEPDGADVFGHVRACAAIRLMGPRVDSAARRLALRKRFGATSAEAAVGNLIAEGHSVSSIAMTTGRSPATVRSHLKALFAKTGATSQRRLAEITQRAIASLHDRKSLAPPTTPLSNAW